jgi:hypothetical protein
VPLYYVYSVLPQKAHLFQGKQKEGRRKMTVTLRIVLIVASALLVLYTLLKIRKAQLDIDDSLHWIVTAIVLILLSLFPNSVVKLSEVLGFISPANLVFLCMIFVVLVRLFVQSVEMSVQKHRLNQLVQKVALLNYEQEQMRKEKEKQEAANSDEENKGSKQ